jgi:hypothetical protein
VGGLSGSLEGRTALAEQLNQHIAVTPPWHTPATQTLASQLLKRTHQLGLSHYPIAVGGYDSFAFGIAFVEHDERVSPLAAADSKVWHSTSDVDIEIIAQVVDHGCRHHIGTLSREQPTNPYIGTYARLI